MKTILVSGASGIVGYGILKSLRNTNRSLRLIGTTIYEESVAQCFCDIFEKAPPTNDENYISWLISVIEKYSIDLIIPGIEADLYKWADYRLDLEGHGTMVLMNSTSLIQLSKDKWHFYQELSNINSPYLIPSSLSSDFDTIVEEFGLPFLLKPRRGFASKGIVKVTSKTVFDLHKEQIGSVLFVQKLVGTDDEEFTTSAFCDGKGSYFASITLKRRLAKDGYTDRAETFEIKGMDIILNHFCNYFKPIGPTNFQFRLHKGVLMLMEINPRISSSTSIRTAFGYNESAMVVDFFLENKIPSQPQLKSGKAIRYVDEKVIYNDGNNI
jgi:carbamoyl-phosphate synthase large subunit